MISIFKYKFFRIYFVFAFLGLFFNIKCTQSHQNDDNAFFTGKKGIQSNFHNFIAKFQIISLPFEIDTGCYEPDPLNSVSLDMANDSSFLDYIGPAVTIGMLPDSSKYYSVIYGTAAACFMPVLAVFTKDGSLNDRKYITKGCGAGAGYRCTERLTINVFEEIVVVNEVEYFLSNYSENSKVKKSKKEIRTSHYHINNFGKIIEKVSLVSE